MSAVVAHVGPGTSAAEAAELVRLAETGVVVGVVEGEPPAGLLEALTISVAAPAAGGAHGAGGAAGEGAVSGAAVGLLPTTCVAGGAADAEALAAAAEAFPHAVRVLVDVLRLGQELPVPQGLTLESLAYSLLLAGPEFASWRAARPVRPLPAEADVVRLAREGDLLTVTLDRPRRRNAFSALMRDQLVEALAVAVADPEVRVELRGEGPNFCSGGDLDEFGSTRDVALAHEVRTQQSPGRLIAALGDRVTAHVHGACIGAGIEIPAFAGRIVAEPDATFRLPELAMGLIPGAGGTVSVARRIGRWRLAWMVLSGATVDAATALDWGLVDEVRAR